MKIGFASDHRGYKLKKELINELKKENYEIIDYGTDSEESTDYPDYAFKLGENVAKKNVDFGVAICGSGIGISIACNKVKGIRCALVHDVFSAKATRCHNDSNILAMGERVIGPGLAREIAKTWLETDFEGGRHTRRVEKIAELEQ